MRSITSLAWRGTNAWSTPLRSNWRRRNRRAGIPAGRRASSRILPGGPRQSWSRERRVIAKAEWTQGEANPRFIVTSLAEGNGRRLYENVYCARGEMKNRIKECQIDLFADRTSTHTMAANQLRLWFASMAYVLVNSLRRLALQTTDLADATCGAIRRKLFKIGALVTISVRRIKFAMASGCHTKPSLPQPIAFSVPPSTPPEPACTSRH